MIVENDKKVAYFSMEVGLNSKIPTYSGGLGILAGDTIKAAADVSLPMVGITLLAKNGFFFQDVKDGKQIEIPTHWQINDFLTPVNQTINVTISGENVIVGCWVKEVTGITGHIVPLYFLHTDFEQNSQKAKNITAHLYGEGVEYRLQQEIILGIAGVKMLEKLGYTNLQKFHMNEGHAAFLSLELLRKFQDKEEVKKRCVFTTHTPVPAGHDIFDMHLVKKELDPKLFDVFSDEYKKQPQLNMTYLALDHSGYTNGVAQKHAEVSRKMFPGYKIESITNGVHARTWTSPHFAKLYDKYIPSWKHEPSSLRSASSIPLNEIWDAHFEGKKQIIDFANAQTNQGLDYDYFTIGWARRFTEYKRPTLLFEDVDRLLKIADSCGPIQIIYAGKAHPKDERGKELVEQVIKQASQLNDKVKMTYLTNYDTYLAKFITAGVDVWLNTPQPPHEASGTSGMKCALNGIPQISVLDGWWEEGCIENETGWHFSTSNELYDLLQNTVVQLFHSKKEEWLQIMQKTIMLNGSFFNTHRMINEYISYAYKV